MLLCQFKEKLATLEESSHSSDNLPGHLPGPPGAQIMMDSDRQGQQCCLIVYNFLFIPKPHITSCKKTSLSLFPVYHIECISLPCFSQA